MSENKDAQDATERFEEMSVEDVFPVGPTNVCRKIKDDGTLVLYECKTGEVYFEGDSVGVRK